MTAAIDEAVIRVEMMSGLAAAATVMERASDQCDQWADQSRMGGWSTHQVDANRRLANDLRRDARQLRLLIGRVTGAEV